MPTQKRRIAVVTGSRAEFGLLRSTLDALQTDPRVDLRVIVAGAHLATGTWKDVRDAGHHVAARVRMQRKGQSGRLADAAATGRGISGFASAFAELKPAILLVLGDRIEAFAAAAAASIAGLHVAHIHGGDRAEGVADEAMRHAISKLAHLHLAATEGSRRRLIRMGEREDLVFNVGSPAVDGLAAVEPVEPRPGLIVLQHPVGASDAQEARWMKATLAATADRARVVLMPNHDPGRAGIVRAIEALREPIIEHLPRVTFVRLLCSADAIVGNSSAGLIEAAVLGTPCVNIGPRQAGREKPSNVVDCDYGEAPVRTALKRALGRGRRKINHPYGPGGTGAAITELLTTIDLNDVPVRKRNTY